MDNEVYSFALKNTLDEIQNICPDIKSSFVFTEDGEVVAGDANTSEKTIVKVIDAFDTILEKAEAVGNIETITLDSTDGRVSISNINKLYLATVTSKNADRNYVNTVTRVLVPTIIKLIEKINSTPTKHNPNPIRLERKPETQKLMPVEKPEDEFTETETEEPRQSIETEDKPNGLTPEPPVNQFIVENIGGLLVPVDTIRIDNDLLVQWQGLYEDRKIQEVEIETFGGKSNLCKVKPIKDSKYAGKGIVQIPEKIQNTLQVKKGELVRVKPIIP